MDETPGSTPAPSTAPTSTAPGAADETRTKKVGRFDKLWEPMRRFWQGSQDSGDSVAATGSVMRTKHRQPRVLFVDTGNVSRSQMAECFARAAGLHAESAGTWPVPSIPSEVLEAMSEKGFDLTDVRPKILDPVRLGAFDRVVLFEVKLPPALTEGARIEEWNDLWDPAGLPLQGYKMVADEIEKRVNRLAKQLHGKQAAAAQKKSKVTA